MSGNVVDRLTSALSDRYAIERELGRGGMATVFLAKDLRHDRQVALKVLHPELAAALGPDRFLQEIQISARLNHPHILTLIDSGEADDLLYYVMPFVEGESLRQRIDREGEMPIADVVRILRDITDALAYAHEHGVVHRDVKPDNVLLSGRHAMVTDFGVAKAVSEATGRQELTTAGVAVGTPAYMAPEQATADPHVDHRADIYAVGVLTYEMLTGQAPFTGGTAQQVLAAHVTETPAPVESRRPTTPAEIASLTMRCLEKKPADRWQKTDELLQQLEGLMTPGSGTTSVATRPPSRSWRVLGFAAVALMALVVAAVLLLRGGGDGVETSPDRFAVIPFAPTTPDTALTRLGKDLVVLLSANMDGVGEISTVDASAILGQGLAKGSPYTLEEGAAVGRSFGAGRIVFGSLVRVGADVRIDAALTTTDGLEDVARITVSAPADSIGVLADSLTWGLLRQIWGADAALAPRLSKDLTESFEALRAFLRGERALVEGRWPAAWEAYEQAIAADSTFLLAYWRYRNARTWMMHGVPQEWREAWFSDSAAMLAALPERERLLLEAERTNTWSGVFRNLEAFTRRYPDYYPGWMRYADRILHSGSRIGYTWEDAIAGFERVVELNPVFVPAWQHLMEASLFSGDTVRYYSAVAALERLGAREMILEGYGFDQIQFLDYMREARYQGTSRPTIADSVATMVLDARMQTGVDFQSMVSMQLVAWATPELQLQVSSEIARREGRGVFATASRRSDPLAWAARGAWDSAAVVMDRFSRSVADSGAAIDAYRIAALAEWLGGLPSGFAERYRAAAVAQVADSVDESEVAWLDGIRAIPLRDTIGLESAMERIRASGDRRAPSLERSLKAFDLALKGATDSAARQMAALEWAIADSLGWATRHPISRAVNRFAANQWLMEVGDTVAAERLVVWTDTESTSPSFWTMACLMQAPTFLQRARIYEGLGRTEQAKKYYREFLRFYDMPTEGLRHLVDEAQAALARLENISEVVERR